MMGEAKQYFANAGSAGSYVMLVLLALLAGCSPDGPRRLPFPTFDAQAPFPELGASAKAADKAAKSEEGGESDFEKAIADSMKDGQEGEDDEDAAAQKTLERQPTIKRQQVPLAGGLASSIPLEFDEWQWSSSGGVTLISHRAPGADQPDALIYVESFSGLMRMFPSIEIRRFQQTVDPALVQSLSLPGLSDGLLQRLSEQTGVDVGRLGDALTRASSHTMGLGLNYRSSKDSFTGWQWVGHNDARVALRMGRTSGFWLTEPRADTVTAGVLGELSQKIGGLSDMQRRYQKVASEQPDTRKRTGWPAWMLLGSAVVEKDVGAHVAIMCKTTPKCAVADELSAFLAQLHPADSATLDNLREQGPKAPLPDFAEQQGLPFAPSDELLPPGEIGNKLRQALPQ